MTRLGIALLWLLHWLPRPVLAVLGDGLGSLLSYLPGKRRRIVAVNLARCFPELPAAERTRLLRANYRATVRAAFETGILWWGSAARVRRLVRVEDAHLLRGDGRRPVIWLAPHFVGLDMGGLRLSLDFPVVSMYSRPKDAAFHKMLLRSRTRFNEVRLYSRHEGIKPIIRELKRGLPFYYLPDQDQGRQGALFAPFFGIAAATVDALPRLARITGAQVVPVVTRQTRGGYVLRAYPAWGNFPGASVEADVARMNAFIEARVRELPAQYFWMHRRFKTRPSGEARFYD